MGKSVRDVMTPTVETASPSQPLSEAAQTMKISDIGSLPVVEEGRLVGMLTDRDIVVRAVAEGVDVNTVQVGDVASREPVTTAPEEDLDDALALMARHRVRRLPVVEDGTLVGVLAQADVALEAKEKNAGEMLRQISQPTSAERE
ncbi:MAG: CBS domain-containing protein [Actinobacteria bacterium]|nr:CBS domain-containing protein [Actinomycetota bacterium]